MVILDDDAFIREVLPSLLARVKVGEQGLVIQTAEDPAHAMRLVRQAPVGQPLVVLADYDLKRPVTGLNVLADVQGVRPDALRILFSGLAAREIRGLETAKIDGFLEKPFCMEDFVEPFRRLLVSGLQGDEPLAATPVALRTDQLAKDEVLHGLLRAQLRGEEARAYLLQTEAERRGQSDEARQLISTTYAWQNRVLELVAHHAPLGKCLGILVQGIEAQVPDVVVGVMMFDEGRLRVAAGPGLPAALRAFLEDPALEPLATPCGRACASRSRVVARDLHRDARFSGLAAAAKTDGLRGCWSTPVVASDGHCHGSLAMYTRNDRPPTAHETLLADLGVGLARLAIESHQARAALHEAESRKSAILESALDAIVTMDAEGRVREWNASAERIFGYTRERAVGSTMAELIIPPEFRAAHWRGLKRFLSTGEARVLGRRLEVRAMRADGTTLPVELAIVALATKPPTFTGFLRDLTQQHEQRDAALASSERLRAIFDQVGVGVAQFALDGRYLRVNQRYCEIVARPQASLLGLRFEDATHDADVAKDRAIFARLLEDGTADITESRLMRPDGQSVWVRRSLSLVRDAHGQPNLVVGIIQEITAEKKALAELRELNATLDARVRDRTKALEDANRDLESFSYIVSHDLRAPLRMLQFLHESVRKDVAAGGQGTIALGQADAALQKMRDLVEGLLALARIAQDTIQDQDVDLSQAVQSALAGLKVSDPGREVKASIQPGLRARGDPRLLQAAIDNLVGNAWKFAAHRAILEITFARRVAEGEAIYTLADNGEGFDPLQAQDVFKPFVRLKSDGTGLGIGLATVRRIIERHGGRIWAEATPGIGAKFHFTLAGTR